MRDLLTVKRMALFVAILLFALFVGKVVWVSNFRVRGDALISGDERADLLSRRNYLIRKVYDQKAGLTSMPTLIPELFQGEWAVGTYSMTTVALTNMAFIYPETREESLRVISAMIYRILKPEFRQFDSRMWREDAFVSLESENGHIGYLGHLNLMLASYKFLGGDDIYDLIFHKISHALQKKIEASSQLTAETYPNEIYIPDNVVVMASLSLHSKLFAGEDAGFLKAWVLNARRRLIDSKTGLLFFSIDKGGRPIHRARGSGAGWNSFYLPFIDQGFAREQYDLMKKHLRKRAFWEGISEWPHGLNKGGDIDSGPLIFGLSPSGTGFAIGGARFHKDEEFLDSLLLTSEIAGFSVQHSGGRRYLFSPLVGDAIMLAMKTATAWDNRFVAD